ncbi:toxin-antitoxin system TumE family protein [Desulfosarcina sp. BuS5]|uniref:toxin-antitoxin system TumE family protein n=1 Tax=Desulfosarcina sp. BuS5 TaxID=933262 RepID=UPI0021016101|nr:DUF6516 family protein [Desulfosarcina sp. BuS5]
MSYACQYKNSKVELIFRYDNAKHKPAFRFLEHKNTKEYAHQELCKGLEKKPIKQHNVPRVAFKM